MNNVHHFPDVAPNADYGSGMNKVHGIFAGLLALTVVASAACGDDASTNQTTSSTSSTGSGGTSGGGQGPGGSTSTSSTSSSSSTSGAGGSACDTWLVTYDLTGSEFVIDAFIDFTITCQAPHNEDHNMGPGTLTLRFADDAGAPAVAGPVTIVDYHMTQNFVTGNNLASVTTALETTAADACGAATGELTGATLTWSPATMQPYCRDGQVSCEGVACGTMGSPPTNQPLVFDNDCSEPLPLDAFEFTNGVGAFTMAAVVTSQDSNQTTTMSLVGTQTTMELDPATPPCACD